MSTSRPPGSLRALLGAWHLLGADPVRLLAPSAAALLVDLALVVGLVRWAVLYGVGAWWVVPAAWLARCAVVGALRAVVLAHGDALLHGRRTDPLRRAPAAALVEVIAGLLAACAAALTVAPFGVVAAALALQGVVPAALLLTAGASSAAWAAVLLVRAALATALPRAVVRRQGVLHALSSALRDARHTFGFALRVLLLGDALRLVGSLLLAAGALPSYPLPLLAILHRLPLPSSASTAGEPA